MAGGTSGRMGSRLKILTVFGTRPEAIKLLPVIAALARAPRFLARTCVTGQHRELLAQALTGAEFVPDHTLSAMREGQTLACLTAHILDALGPVLESERPDLVLVQGDTATAFAAATAAHYRRIPVAHIEAGLRSGDLHHPWPEEFHRKAIGALAAVHFAPTVGAAAALRRENVPAAAIHVTGNTGIDALAWMADRIARDPALAPRMAAIEAACSGRRIIGATCHRRENFGDGVAAITDALARLAERDDVAIVLPLHPNPAVLGPMRARLGDRANIHLVEPFDYPDFVRLLQASHLLLTDSGGVQEEAPGLGTPVLVMRTTTERPEGIAAGAARLVGTDPAIILREANRLLDDPQAHAAMANVCNPYGDGQASGRIVEVLGRMAG